MGVPGVGPLLASVTAIAEPKAFRLGGNLAAWIGLVPGRVPAVQRNGAKPESPSD